MIKNKKWDPVEFWWQVPESGYRIAQLEASSQAHENQLGIPVGKDTGSYLVLAAEYSMARTYRPLDESGLFKEFAATEESNDAIVEFAGRYGFLGGDYVATVEVSLPTPEHSTLYLQQRGELCRGVAEGNS